MTHILCMRLHRIVWLLLYFIACDARSTVRRNNADPPAETRGALASELRRSLREDVLAPFYPRAVDREEGGFLSQFDYDGRALMDAIRLLETPGTPEFMTRR